MFQGKHVSVIIAAAGSARRMRGIDKIFMKLGDRPVLAQVVKNFEDHPSVDEIVIAVREDQVPRCGQLAEEYAWQKVTAILPGGQERPDTVRRALDAVSREAGIILVQDGARPFADSGIISRILEAVHESGAAVPVIPVKDTIKFVENGESGMYVAGTPERSRLRAVQTPQGFDAELLRKLYGIPENPGDTWQPAEMDGVTDDASLAERAGCQVRAVEGSEDNLKITTAEDVEKAELILRRRSGEAPRGQQDAGEKNGWFPQLPRTGIGFDVHAFAEDRKLILGGVEIPYEKGLAGHSDADVLVHAIMDALLGACALRDIGYYFPDTDPAYEGADSMVLLSRVRELLEKDSWQIVNVDAVVMAQAPKLSPHIGQMKQNIASVLALPEDAVGVKATTTERLGFTGRKEGIAVQAVASVIRR